MIHFFDRLFDTGDLQPLGATWGWRSDLVGLHAVSHTLLALAYLVIPAAIGIVLWRRRDLARSAQLIGVLFIVFIVTASMMHLAQLLTLWTPAYGLVSLLKVLTAATASATAIAIWPQIPRLLALPSPRDLARANLALVQANASLETTVAWRTHEIELTKQRFEQAMARSNTTVFTLDTDLRYTWIYNPRSGGDAEAMLGRTAEEVFPSHEVDESLPLKRRALNSGETVNATVAVPTEDAGRLYLDMTVSPTVDKSGVIDGVLCTATDVTEKRLFEIRLAAMAGQLAAAYQRFYLALEESPISVFEQDADLRYTYIHNPPSGTQPETFLGRTDAEIFSERDASQLEEPKLKVLVSGQRESIELEVEIAGEPRFFQLTLDARTGDAGQPLGVLGIALDVTDRRRDERRMRLMMRELTHRSKNLLAVIQAMARKTASLSDDIEEFIAAFSARLRAMSAAHDLLVSQSWHGADLGDLIRASVAQTIAPTAEQVRIAGPALLLAPDTAQNLGLAFHELATNASKYGALAVDRGEIAVTWSAEGDEVHIRWQESGGPAVKPPERIGFGRVLLERLVGTTLNGSVRLDFARDGLRCDIVFPRDRLIEATPPPAPSAPG
jgi:two-component sensor histidine kinase